MSLEFAPTCWHCGATLSPEEYGRREVCSHCGCDVHVCRNCRFYNLGSYNACREPLAERVVDKERANFCEYFEAGAVETDASSDQLIKQAEALFKFKV